MRALVFLLAALLLVPSVTAAAPTMFASTLDDRIGDVRERLEQANATYGPRSEFDSARVELGRSGVALIQNGSVISADNLAKAAGALETGRARALAQGSTNPSERVLERADQLAGQAEAKVVQLRSDLRSMERTGLEPVALDGGIAVGYTLLRAMDMLQQYRTAKGQWGQGDHSEPVERTIISSAAAAVEMAQVAEQLLGKVSQARAEAPIEPFLPHQELEALSADRVQWVEARPSPGAQMSRERLIAIHNSGDQLLTLSAYLIWFQDVAFNGIHAQIQQGNSDLDPYQEARTLLNETHPAAQSWLEALGIEGDLAVGALESARFSLEMVRNAPPDAQDQTGAYATSLVHLGAEHIGLIQQAYGEVRHEPGTGLQDADVPKRADQPVDPLIVTGLVVVGLVALGGAGALYLRRNA